MKNEIDPCVQRYIDAFAKAQNVTPEEALNFKQTKNVINYYKETGVINENINTNTLLQCKQVCG